MRTHRAEKGIRNAVIAVLAAIVTLVASGHMASAVTIDFSTINPPADPGGALPGPTATLGGIVVDAFYFSGSGYTQTGSTLFVRRDAAEDRGLGVCSPDEQSTTACTNPFSGGGGDINELDNAGGRELIRLTLPTGETWVSVWLSSLDCNGLPCTGIGSDPESGRLYYSSSNGLASGNLGTLYTSFSGSANANREIPITTIAAQTATYLYFIPKGGHDNDYLVWKATTEGGGGGSTQVPMAWTLTLVALGLPSLGTAFAIRRSLHP